MANIYNIKSMTLNYDGGLSGQVYLRRAKTRPPATLISPTTTDGTGRMDWRRGEYVDCPIPSSAQQGDLLVVVGGDIEFFTSQPVIYIDSAGWNTIINSEASSAEGFVAGWRYHNGTDTHVRLRGGTSSSWIYIVGGKVMVFRNAKVGNHNFGVQVGANNLSLSLNNPSDQFSTGRLVYGSGGRLDTGPGNMVGGSGESELLISDGNPPSGTWRFATAVMWDSGGTDETYNFSYPNGDGTHSYMIVIEVSSVELL